MKNKTYTITIEIQAESEQEAFIKLEAAVNGSYDFSMLRHRLDSCYLIEDDYEEFLGEELIGQQKLAFDEQMKEYLENKE